MYALKKALAVLTLILVSLFSLTPASAHTEIDHTTPNAGSTIDAGTKTISIVFTDKILNLADSSEVVITDGNGDEVVTSCLEVKNASLNIEAFLATDGDYKVVWRTVAEDGHPITGNFGFTVTGTAEDSAFVSCKDLASEGNVMIATPKAEPLAVEDKKPTADTGVVWPYWAVGFVLSVVWLIAKLRRRKNTKD